MSTTRRAFLAGTGLGGAAAGLGIGVDLLTEQNSRSAAAPNAQIGFFGEHQAGTTTPTQEHLQFATFDLVTESRADLRTLLRTWSAAAVSLSRGQPVGPLDTGPAPPGDTGENVGLGPSSLTVSFGLGTTLFTQRGRDRFGLASARPAPLVELPAFTTDALDPTLCGGDLAIQICADDPQVAFHALHNLIRLGSPAAVPRWALAGFGRTSNSRDQTTPRNLMGFKDGTNNIMAEDRAALDRFVWARAPESPPWMYGGSYMVVRRIEIMLGAWDATSLTDQEQTFGRHKLSGAPLTGSREHDPVKLNASTNGIPTIPAGAHIRLASPTYNDGHRILRRGYSYLDGIDPATGSASGGVLFICFQRDPRTQFIAIQRQLAQNDALNRHTQHIGSAIFACPPGVLQGSFIAEPLLA
jgi:deferrochelatase/peroxidase EfeB